MKRGLVVAMWLAACGSPSADGPPDATDQPTDDAWDNLVLPPLNAGLDYQLGGAYPPPTGVQIVSRDRTAASSADVYNICYVNGFQIQPGEEDWWIGNHMDLILRDGNGDPVIDPDWNEMLIDVSTPTNRSEVAAIVGGWITGCKASGFNAIEIDNLDSYTRSGGRLSEADAVATMRLLSDVAHSESMPIAQKNAAEMVGRKAEMGTDFAIAEECNQFAECDVYTSGYGDHVLVIEYQQSAFTAGCSMWGNRLSIVLRDLDLVPTGQAGYVFDDC